jgi:hypothetical protein
LGDTGFVFAALTARGALARVLRWRV